ncbi:MAG: GNAT family N-acetyltransferase [Lachnospiraceae bacterium]|nr:GNAT family N-acetyltransferase [Ruminococcus sp.]MCM1273945.1 GNAT family N-acetyltransferase [Lachnospiraceae bacterium]
MIEYRELNEAEINRELFAAFIRRQVVTDCWRRVNGEWTIKSDPFIDDWSEEDYAVLIKCLKNTVSSGGVVYGAFDGGALKGFASVEPRLFGGEQKYLDLSSMHVSQDRRGRGIGRALFARACAWARAHGAEKLYISAHSAVESRAFYTAVGCVEAVVYNREHVRAEPFDCQLERKL